MKALTSVAGTVQFAIMTSRADARLNPLVCGSEGATDLHAVCRDAVERLLDGLNGRERS